MHTLWLLGHIFLFSFGSSKSRKLCFGYYWFFQIFALQKGGGLRVVENTKTVQEKWENYLFSTNTGCSPLVFRQLFYYHGSLFSPFCPLCIPISSFWCSFLLFFPSLDVLFSVCPERGKFHTVSLWPFLRTVTCAPGWKHRDRTADTQRHTEPPWGPVYIYVFINTCCNHQGASWITLLYSFCTSLSKETQQWKIIHCL